MERTSLALIVYSAVPAIILAAGTLAIEVPSFFDPCLSWGQKSSGSVELPSEGSCAQGVSGRSDTKGEAVMRLLLIDGGILLGCALGILGLLKANLGLTLSGSAILIVESVPLALGFSWVLTAISAFLFPLIYWVTRKETRTRLKGTPG